MPRRSRRNGSGTPTRATPWTGAPRPTCCRAPSDTRISSPPGGICTPARTSPRPSTSDPGGRHTSPPKLVTDNLDNFSNRGDSHRLSTSSTLQDETTLTLSLALKMNLLVDQSGAPLSVVLTGANRHEKVAAIELIVSVGIKRPAHKEQHLCADKACDASDVREFASSEGYTTHIKVNPTKKDSTQSSSEHSQEEDSHGEPHPARRWVVERTISWLTKRCGLRTRWSKKAENWLALIQLACAHVLLNLAVLG